MSAVAINLIPGEAAIKQKQQDKFSRIQLIATIAVLFSLLLASCLFALRIIQNQTILNVKDEAQRAEEKVISFKDKESTLIFLKNRVNLISQIQNDPLKPTSAFAFVNSIIPGSVGVASISVNRSEQVLFSALMPDGFVLGELLTSLTNDSTFERVSSIAVETLARNREGSYRSNMKVIPK